METKKSPSEYVTMKPTIHLEQMPDEFEDWFCDYNDGAVNDGWVSVYLEDISELAYMKDWLLEFITAFPNQSEILVYVSY